METCVADDYAAIAQRLREIDAECKAEDKPPSSSSWAVMDEFSRAGRRDGFYRTRRHP